jgi:orotate phosphoribosyltransferase
LERLFVSAKQMEDWVQSLATQASSCCPQVVCGPLTGGAFVAQLLAATLQADFVYTERHVTETGVHYSLPNALKEVTHRRRILITDDAINAGSALLATRAELLKQGADIVGYASLLLLSKAVPQIAQEQGVPLYSLLSLESNLWEPNTCPLCVAGVSLQDFVPT